MRTQWQLAVADNFNIIQALPAKLSGLNRDAVGSFDGAGLESRQTGGRRLVRRRPTGMEFVLVTPGFVMLNFPKTGSSFARHVVRELYLNRLPVPLRLLARWRLYPTRFREISSPRIDEEIGFGIRDQHGTYRQIPAEHRGKPVITVVRNPLSRYVSTYRYKWWLRHLPAPIDVLRRRYPSFPDLSFDSYYEMIHEFGRRNRLRGIETQSDLGLHTIQFIQFYSEDPASLLATLDDSAIDSKRRETLIPANIQFLRQEHLHHELRASLRGFGFSHRELQIIDSTDRINVTAANDPENDGTAKSVTGPMMSDETRAAILYRDRLLFNLFPEYAPAD